jgi:hypothetical protein
LGTPEPSLVKPWASRTRGLSTYDKDYLAILIAIDQWRTYLQLAEFIILTDQKSLTHLSESQKKKEKLNTPI